MLLYPQETNKLALPRKKKTYYSLCAQITSGEYTMMLSPLKA